MKHLFNIYKVIAVAVIGCLLCPCFVFATLVEEDGTWVEDSSIDTSWFDATQPKKEYSLSTEAQLRGLANLVNKEQYYWKPNRNESFAGVTFTLTRDITLTEDWTPIGVDEQLTFKGTFNGRGHSITGLSVESDSFFTGFFGHLTGKVCNLSLEGDVSATTDYCGSVAGYVDKDATVQNCDCNVQVSGKKKVGGIAGESHGTIYGSINRGEVIGASMVGGIVGESRGGTVMKCGNRGLIYSNGAGSFNNGTGGVAGRSVSASTLSDSYNVGDIISSNEATGGVVGYTNSSGSSIINCYSIGSIRIEEPQVTVFGVMAPSKSQTTDTQGLTGSDLPVYAGGIAGNVGTQEVRIENCYNTGTITGADYAGGIIGKCQNAMFTANKAKFYNNYYAEGSFDGAIAADRDDKPMKIRGAATGVSESSFGHLASSLGDAYIDDKSGDYGSKGYPVLVWQGESVSDDSLAMLRHVDSSVLHWLNDASLALETGDIAPGHLFLQAFNPDTLYEDPEEMAARMEQGKQKARLLRQQENGQKEKLDSQDLKKQKQEEKEKQKAQEKKKKEQEKKEKQKAKELKKKQKQEEKEKKEKQKALELKKKQEQEEKERQKAEEQKKRKAREEEAKQKAKELKKKQKQEEKELKEKQKQAEKEKQKAEELKKQKEQEEKEKQEALELKKKQEQEALELKKKQEQEQKEQELKEKRKAQQRQKLLNQLKQKESLSEDQLAVLNHVDPVTLQWLYYANLVRETGEFTPGGIFLQAFDPEILYQNTEDMAAPWIQEKQRELQQAQLLKQKELNQQKLKQREKEALQKRLLNQLKQEKSVSEDNLTVLRHVDPYVLQWLEYASLANENGEFTPGDIFLQVFNPEILYQNTEKYEKQHLPAFER